MGGRRVSLYHFALELLSGKLSCTCSMLTLIFEQSRSLSYGFIILISRYQLLRQVTPDDTSGERL